MDECGAALRAEVPPLPAVHSRVGPQLVGPGERPLGALWTGKGPLPLPRRVNRGLVEPEVYTFTLAMLGSLLHSVSQIL